MSIHEQRPEKTSKDTTESTPKKKKVKCKKCDELFVFYMQMKRHMERDH